MKFEIFQSHKTLNYYFRLKAANGKTIATSGAFETKVTCRDAIEIARVNLSDDKNIERRKSKDGRHYFVIQSNDGKLLLRSQLYASSSSLKGGVKSVKKGVDATTEDLTTPSRLPKPKNWLMIEEGSSVPNEVLEDYLKALKKLLRSMDVKTDTPSGQLMSKYLEEIENFPDSFETFSGADLSCFGTVGTAGTYACAGTVGGTAGTAGSVGSAGTLGCGESCSLCWNCGDDDDDDGDGDSG